MEYTITLALSERLLKLIEIGVTEKNLDSEALLRGVCYQIVFSTLAATMYWFTQIIQPKLKTRFQYYYEKELMRGITLNPLSSFWQRLIKALTSPSQTASRFDNAPRKYESIQSDSGERMDNIHGIGRVRRNDNLHDIPAWICHANVSKQLRRSSFHPPVSCKAFFPHFSMEVAMGKILHCILQQCRILPQECIERFGNG